MTADTEFRRFHNGLRILINLGMRDLEQAGVIEECDWEDWTRFQKNPHLYFVQISEARAEKLWALIEKHQPADLRRSNLHPVMAQVLAPFVDDPK
jgi:hypothetical protein